MERILGLFMCQPDVFRLPCPPWRSSEARHLPKSRGAASDEYVLPCLYWGDLKSAVEPLQFFPEVTNDQRESSGDSVCLSVDGSC